VLAVARRSAETLSGPLGVVLRLKTNADGTSLIGFRVAESATGATDTAKIVCQVVKWIGTGFD
jgi:hypothetical protein